MTAWAVPSWEDVKAAWSAGWKTLAEQAEAAYAAAIRANPGAYVDKVTGFLAALTASRETLDRIRAKLPDPPVTDADRAAWAKYRDLERRYHDLAAGFYADTRPTEPATGAAPAAGVVIIIGAIAVGVVGVAWAVAAYEYAVNLQDQTALAERELDARVEASREGRSLQPSTLPPPPPSPEDAAKGIGWLLVGGLVLTAGAVALPALLRK
jgi:hypothetical protein